MMQGVFVQALTYRPPVILGRQMRMFSPWHGLMLEAAGNAFVCGGRLPGIEDLVAGAWICGLRFIDGIEACGDLRAIRRWGRRHGAADLAAAALEFREYVDVGGRCPEYWRDAKGKAVKAPYWWHLALFARERLGMDEAAAWDAPVARLACYRACHAESEGWDKLKSAEEIAGSETLKADAAAAAGK